MNYQVSLNGILGELKKYCDCIDAMCVTYNAEINAFEQKLQGMKGTYTKEYIDETRKNWEPSKDYAGEMRSLRDKAKVISDFHLKSIRKQLDSFFASDLNMNFANKITTAKALGMKLTAAEMNVLQGEAKSYFDKRVLNEYAKEIGYGGVVLPDHEQIMRAYDMFASSVKNCINRYCGENAELYAYIDDNSLMKQNNPVLAKAMCTSVNGIIRDENSTTNNFVTAMNDIVKCDGESIKTILSTDDVKLIDALIPDYEKYPQMAQKQAGEIAKANSDIAALLVLDNRYSESVTAAMSEE